MGASEDFGGYGPRSVHMGRVETDLDKIEEIIKRFERDELIRTLLDGAPIDDNVEELLQEVLMVLKMIHGEEVGKSVSTYHKILLEKRERSLKRERQNKIKIKLDRVKAENKKSTLWNKSIGPAVRKVLGLDDDDDRDGPR